jgi:hypothetical protein
MAFRDEALTLMEVLARSGREEQGRRVPIFIRSGD